jgi:predicted methyltransferase
LYNRRPPELHAAAKALADKAYPSLTAAINAAVASKDREPGNADRDQYRHPLKTLAFFGLTPWLGEIHSALKSGGILGIEEHRAKPDADPRDSSKKGYLPEKWLVERVEAAGFKLAGKSEVNANPKDAKDYSAGVWALPPSLQLGDQDRAKYLAIGESDRMTLKFVKAADKPADAKSGGASP